MTHSDEDATLTYRYTFLIEDGTKRQFEVKLDYETLGMICPKPAELPDWTRLDFCKCENCPLEATTHERCPVAVNLIDLIECFRNMESYDEVDVSVEAKNRQYTAHTSLQKGIGALIGLVMVTSGCPVMNRMRPMVDTHLPFMTLEESTYRIISMYLTAQHFIKARGGTPDWDLQGLLDLLTQTHLVNVGFTQRLRSMRIRDASLNAVVNLSASSNFISTAMESNWLARFEKIFVDHAGWGEGPLGS
jgi:hypothetical protein